MPKAQDVERAALGIIKDVDNAAVLLRGIDFGGFMEHGVEQMHTFVAHGCYMEHGFTQ